MGKNTKNDKKARNDEAVKEIREKQSQKRKQQRMLQQKELANKQNTSEIKTKQQEREGFVSSLRKVECYAQRVAAECAERKRKEAYLKYVNYEPKLEQNVYYSKKTEGKGEI